MPLNALHKKLALLVESAPKKSSKPVLQFIASGEILELTIPSEPDFRARGVYIRISYESGSRNFKYQVVFVVGSLKPKTAWYAWKEGNIQIAHMTSEEVKRRVGNVLKGHT